MDKMRKQAERWGATLHTEDVERVDFSVRPFVIESSERVVKAHSVILATGATAKRLKIPSEETFWSRGISACAICDGPSPIFKGEELAVVGGGDTATEEALYLTKYGKHVHLLVRGEKIKARYIHWSPYDRVGVMNADPEGLLPSSLFAHPSLSIPDLDAFELQLTPLNSTPTFARMERP